MPKPPGPINQLLFNPGSNAFDLDAFDELIAAQGVELVHWRSMRNPGGMVDRFDSRRPGEDHLGASNGMVYTMAGCFVGALLGNSKDLKAATGGLLDNSQAQLTAPRFYDSPAGAPVYLQQWDRLYLKEESILVTNQQLAEVSATLVDRLRFPLVEVQDLMDADGRRYEAGTDYSITAEGNLAWKNPPQASGDGKPRVYGIRYLYRPFWYVERLMHEIRVAQSLGVDGKRVLQRGPQEAFVQREFVYRNEEADPAAPNPNSPRQGAGPDDGGFGAR